MLCRNLIRVLTMLCCVVVLTAPRAEAESENDRKRTSIFDNDVKTTNERYVPGIWVDPDGCEHWVMDDGFEGYMTPHVTRQGIPVCRRGNVCGVMNSDQFFATNSYRIGPNGRAKLRSFFRDANARSFIINGHTDSRASDAYNMELSRKRARAVAAVARAAGASVSEVRGYGERRPIASNQTSAGMAKNRRVEIICVR